MSDYLAARSSSIPIPLSLTSDSSNDNLPDLIFDDDPQFIEYDKLTNYSSNQAGANGNVNNGLPEGGANTTTENIVGTANGLFLTDTNYQQRNHYRKVAHLSTSVPSLSASTTGKSQEEWKDNRQGLTIQHVLR
jgi:hypothetical protein